METLKPSSEGPENIIAAEIKPLPNKTSQTAVALQQLGFRILHIGQTISVQGAQPLWEATFNVTFELRKKIIIPEAEGSEVSYQKALTEKLRILPELQPLIEEVFFTEPPEFY
jgi:hypothetical protein